MSMRQVVLVSLLILHGSIGYAAKIDAGLFTTYTTPGKTKTELNWVVCGSVGTTFGCYGVGTLSPFGKIASVIEGSKSYNISAGTVTRYLYVIDSEYGSAKDGVALYAYKRVDTITSSLASTIFTLEKTLSLPLTGGSSAAIYAAGNTDYLLIGSSLSTLPAEVTKKTYAINNSAPISGAPISITADNYGYITFTTADDFFVIGPNGESQLDGGGTEFTINTIAGVQP
jgi:hypothetical protein